MQIDIYEETVGFGPETTNGKSMFSTDFDDMIPQNTVQKRQEEVVEKPVEEVSRKSRRIAARKTKKGGNLKSCRVNLEKIGPLLREPFAYGWKRELVMKHPETSGVNEHGYVYYVSPTGEKFRTFKQIDEYLPKKGKLSLKNFNFALKMSLGLEDAAAEFTKAAQLRGVVTHDAESIARKTGVMNFSDENSSQYSMEFFTENETPPELDIIAPKPSYTNQRKAPQSTVNIKKVERVTVDGPLGALAKINAFVYNCPNCGQNFCQIATLVKHINTVCPLKAQDQLKGIIRCPHCPKCFTLRGSLFRHVSKFHKPIKCKICNAGCESENHLEQHQKKCEERLKLKCHKCKYWTFKKIHLILHLQRKHGEISDDPNECPMCHKVFKNPGALNCHVYYSYERTFRKCPHCPYKTKITNHLKKHVQGRHGSHFESFNITKS